jgi:DNA-binding beta-propeller fold protein YncE
MTIRRVLLICIFSLFNLEVRWNQQFHLCLGQEIDRQQDTVSDRKTPSGRELKPAGELLTFAGRPVDIQLSRDGRWLFAKSNRSLLVIDPVNWKVVQSIESKEGASLWGLAVASDNRVYFTDSRSNILVFAPSPQGDPGAPYSLERTIPLAAESFPCGISLSPDETKLYVCLSKHNAVGIVDIASGESTHRIDVGIAPLDLSLQSRFLFVSNMGGRRAKEGDRTAPSADTPTVVDERGVANNGTVSVIDLQTHQVIRETRVKLQPSTMAGGLVDNSVIVCNSNDDSLSIVGSQAEPIVTHVVKPDDRLAFGSMPSAISRINHQNQYAVALAGNNALAILQWPDATTEKPTTLGFVPTAWYPSAIAHDQNYLYVACVKGIGSRSRPRPEAEGLNSHDYLGSVQRIPLAKLNDAEQMKRWTAEVMETSKVKEILEANEMADAKPNVKAVPFPEALGQPSIFRHVIYVIKENRTFDQIFGDLEQTRSMPELCIFPERLTPNHHALARRFGILDNYYCNGVLSADGHSWATEGNVTPYLERAFGGFNRSYTFGDDPITFSSSGFVWDHVLAGGFSFRNYGEFDYATAPDKMEYQEIWERYQRGEPIEFQQNIGVEKMRRYSCRDYPGWNMAIPDVLRMDRFLKEFREFEKNGNLPNFILIYLPQDHLGGGVTSESHMADNDLALGRLVEAISHSRFWKETVLFVNEDDPQNGYDHIDGHRSLCLVISPYSKPGVNSNFYNQTSVLRSMLHIFGLPPMNQQDASMPLMNDCFQPVADLRAFDALPANILLNQAPPEKDKQSAKERNWREILATVPIERTGMKTERDEDNLNRFVWHEMRGWNAPYPVQWAGAHGKGLKDLGLQHDPKAEGSGASSN